MTTTWQVNPLELQELEEHLLKLSSFEGFQREATKTQMMLMVVQNYTRIQIEQQQTLNAMTRIQELVQCAIDNPEFEKDILRSVIHAVNGVTLNAS